MARYRYRPYRSSKASRRRIIITAIAAVILIAVIVAVIRNVGDNEKDKLTMPDGAEPIRKSEGTNVSAESGETEEQVIAEEDADSQITNKISESAAEKSLEGAKTSEQADQFYNGQKDQQVQNEVVENPSVKEQVTKELSQATDPEVSQLIVQANQDLRAGKIITARNKLNDCLSMQISYKDRKIIQTLLSSLSDKWLFSSKIYPEDNLTDSYAVKPGDRLEDIGDEYKVPYQVLMRINNIENPRLLRAGSKIKVIKGPFHAIISRSDFTMDLYLGKDMFVKTYKVGLGKDGRITPTGSWIVKKGGKLVKPNWTDPDTGKTYIAEHPEYPLGARWIALEGLSGNAVGKKGFALHGTNDPESIGTNSSRGCIRLENSDIIEVFSLLKEGHSKIKVLE
jgi:lipoprotein-anchoring transpeptidase ErfK/SrfK